MRKFSFVLFLYVIALPTLFGQYFKTTFTYTASTGLLNFYIKPTGGNLSTAIESFQFDVTYPIGANVNFGTVTNNTAVFQGLSVSNTNSFTLNGGWVYRFEHQGLIPSQFYAQNAEYLVFSVQLSGSGATTLGYKSDYDNFDPVFTVNDDSGNPLWDNTSPHDIYYPNQLQNGNIVYILLNVTLPLELTVFEAKNEESSITLNWTTENEFDFSGFELQRSVDGINFSKIAFLQSTGTNETANYRFTDKDVVSSNPYFYRLKMIDNDGSYSFSGIISGKRLDLRQNELIDITISENSHIEVGFELAKEDYLTINIFDLNGKVIARQTAFYPAGRINVDFDLSPNQSGIYCIQIGSSEYNRVKKFAFAN
jgi:hypothetical protein